MDDDTQRQITSGLRWVGVVSVPWMDADVDERWGDDEEHVSGACAEMDTDVFFDGSGGGTNFRVHVYGDGYVRTNSWTYVPQMFENGSDANDVFECIQIRQGLKR